MKKILTFLKRLGYNHATCFGAGYDLSLCNPARWVDWYAGFDKSFHCYVINRGSNMDSINCRRSTLNMAKRGCEDWANLLWNDDCHIGLEGITEVENDLFNMAMSENKFTEQTTRLIENAFATGTGAYSIFYKYTPTGVRYPVIDYYRHMRIYPLGWDNNGNVHSCAFPSWEIINGDMTVYIRIVERVNNIPGANYLVRNVYAVAEKNEPELRIVPIPRDSNGIEIVEDEYTTIYKPFELVYPNIVNNINPNSPMGISVNANAIDTLKAIDLAFDGACTAMKLCRPRIGVSESMATWGDSRKPTFDPADMGVYVFDNLHSEDMFVKDLTPAYVADKYEASLQEQLNIYGQQIGLGDKAYRYDTGTVRTATEVISNNSGMLRTMEKHQASLRNAVETASRAVCEILDINPTDINITFDDSVTRDREAERKRWYGFVMDGHISMAEYLMRFEGLSKDEAERMVQSNAALYNEEL